MMSWFQAELFSVGSARFPISQNLAEKKQLELAANGKLTVGFLY